MEIRRVEIEFDADEDARAQQSVLVEFGVGDGTGGDLQHQQLLRQHFLQLRGRNAKTVGGHGNVIKLTNGTFAEAADPKARMRFEIVEYENRKKPVQTYGISDIGVNYIGLECSDIDSLVARLKGFGAPMVSDGIVEMKTGYRVALVRDPDVGMFVELYEPPKK